MLVETVVRIWNLAHLRFSVLKADLLKRAHFLFGLLLQSKNSGSGRMGRYQLENQSTNCLRLMLPGSTPKVYVRSKPLTPSTPVSQFSLARDPAIDTRVCIAKILFSSGINSLHTFLSDSIFVGLWLGLLNRCLQSHRSLLLKNLALRQQLAVLKRNPRPRMGAVDKTFWVFARRFWGAWKQSLVLVNPETVVRWHRAGFRLYWSWISKARTQVGRKKLPTEVRELIFRMMAENPTWNAPRIHGELLMLGFDASERTIFRLMKWVPRDPQPAQALARISCESPGSRANLASGSVFDSCV